MQQQIPGSHTGWFNVYSKCQVPPDRYKDFFFFLVEKKKTVFETILDLIFPTPGKHFLKVNLNKYSVKISTQTG